MFNQMLAGVACCRDSAVKSSRQLCAFPDSQQTRQCPPRQNDVVPIVGPSTLKVAMASCPRYAAEVRRTTMTASSIAGSPACRHPRSAGACSNAGLRVVQAVRVVPVVRVVRLVRVAAPLDRPSPPVQTGSWAVARPGRPSATSSRLSAGDACPSDCAHQSSRSPWCDRRRLTVSIAMSYRLASGEQFVAVAVGGGEPCGIAEQIFAFTLRR